MRRHARLVLRPARSDRQIRRKELRCHSHQTLPGQSVTNSHFYFPFPFLPTRFSPLFCRPGHTTGVTDGFDDSGLSEEEKRYQTAMSWLTTPTDSETGSTRIGLYREKQAKYTDALERKTKAFNAALDQAVKDPRNNTVHLQRTAYDRWVSENYKTYNNYLQAAYMDWVTLGKKEQVEYYFSIVDNDSAMSRVEASKVCEMREPFFSNSHALWTLPLVGCDALRRHLGH